MKKRITTTKTKEPPNKGPHTHTTCAHTSVTVQIQPSDARAPSLSKAILAGQMGLLVPAQGCVGVSREFRQRTILIDETPFCGGSIQLTITTIQVTNDRVHADTITARCHCCGGSVFLGQQSNAARRVFTVSCFVNFMI